MTCFNLEYFLRGSLSKYSHMEGVCRASIYEFGGEGEGIFSPKTNQKGFLSELFVFNRLHGEGGDGCMILAFSFPLASSFLSSLALE